MFLVDTNVISESRKRDRANTGVQTFLRSVDPTELYLCVQTIGEIRHGIENIQQRDSSQAKALEQWLNFVVLHYGNRILDFDLECAQLWGRLMSPGDHHPVDKQIAAIALVNDLTVVTRNVADFRDTGVTLQNPFH